MKLQAGGHLAHYEIVEAIGKGGMGEVYRAKDTKLGRDVAIKVLPEDFARDPERLARFKREAQVLASLNHPNIAAIHGLEEHDSQPFLVLELVEGEDLAERLKRGPLPIDEVTEIAKQIAEALEEAHEKGIIHRDLKPANVKQTPEGVVKVLDFGLAKAFSGETSQDVNMSDSPTLTRNATRAGVILGTAAYMSPEQAKAKPVDRRADIWSFGVLVYEMLTGVKAFARDDVSETLAAVLRDEPDWNKLPPATPSKLRSLLERCLRKNPRERQRDMGDARLELTAPEREVTTARKPTRAISALVVGVAIGALGIASLWMMDMPSPPLVTKMVILLPQGQRLVERLTPPLAISPDGRTVVYAAENEGAMGLYRRPLDTDEATFIRGTEGGHSPFFSPDGEWLGFFTNSALKKIPSEGGASTTLAPAEDTNLGATWGPDGTIVYSPTAGAGRYLLKVSQAGGEPEPLYEGVVWTPTSPQFLPDGDTVLFRRVRQPELHAASLGSGTLYQPEAPDNFIAYVASGHLLHWSDDAVAAAPFDANETSAEAGNAAVVLEGVASMIDARVDSSAYLAVSPSGTMAYVSGARREQRLVLVSRDGSVRVLANGPFHAPRVSPDGRRIAYNTDGVWIYDLDRATKGLVSAVGSLASWRHDGRALATTRSRIVHEIPADGSDEGTPLLPAGEHFVHSWSNDGRFLALGDASSPTGDLWILPVGEERQPYLVTEHDEHAARFSPNDRFIAYISDESGQREVYVRPFPKAEGLVKISTNGGTAPVWSRDGSELFYREGKDLMSVEVDIEGEFRAGTPELVLSGDFHVDASGHAGYDVMPDGQSFVMIQENEDAPLTEIHVVLNWFEELNRLVPTDQ